MSGFEQLLAHLWGDYILQSDWMAQNKTKSHLAAAVHAVTYSLLFLFFRPSIAAFAVILGTHFLIDRYRLARYVVWAKNWIGLRRIWLERTDYCHGKEGTPYLLGELNDTFKCPDCSNTVIAQEWVNPPLRHCPTGYPSITPVWVATWLLIIADNILHLTINYLALRYLA